MKKIDTQKEKKLLNSIEIREVVKWVPWEKCC